MAAVPVKKSKSALFLIELIIAILFFALSSAVCAQLFAKAHLISQKSTDVTMAVNRAQTAAEEFYHAAPDGETWESVARFDAQWNAAGEAEAVFELRLTGALTADGLKRGAIEVWRIGAQEPLYTLRTSVYAGKVPA